MSDHLDKSLDEIIKTKEKSRSASHRDNPQFRGRAGGFHSDTGPAPVRRFTDRASARPAPYLPPNLSKDSISLLKRPQQVVTVTLKRILREIRCEMQSLRVQETLIGGVFGADADTGKKLYISNLDFGVSNEDIKVLVHSSSVPLDGSNCGVVVCKIWFCWCGQVLFSEVGFLKRYGIHYDQSGRSKGTADVVFARWSDALAAIKRYNNVQLDGKPMQIELVGVKLVSILPTPGAGAPSVQEMIKARGWDNRGGGRKFGKRAPEEAKGREQGKSRSKMISLSSEDLDADLDNYLNQARELGSSIRF
ncbi:hypothetical protein RJ639_033686 [Escallonia herrerae]|uniref:RRM domain-containing protein n=1 Tax=Escallonia herrerae TaxID=1293975 RepID=A0AA88X969_9ASTE|nr:hypothetical protein RJ639_033686 [Escallonia herrerae]